MTGQFLESFFKVVRSEALGPRFGAASSSDALLIVRRVEEKLELLELLFFVVLVLLVIVFSFFDLDLLSNDGAQSESKADIFR